MKNSFVANYYCLSKPGIIRGNLLTAAAGFLLASGEHVDVELLMATLVGMALVVAAGCVFNNILDRKIDKAMARTKDRALVSGKISAESALIYAVILATAGFAVLELYTNKLTVFLGITALFLYVVVYGYFKRRSHYGTVVGSIPGALPPVAAYSAVTNDLDLCALLLFLILIFWQMPHFYAIAIYRLEEYKAANLAVLPAVKSLIRTKLYMLLYILAFAAASFSLFAVGVVGYAYFAVMILLNVIWLALGLNGLFITNSDIWAKKMFQFSLIVISLLCIAISAESIL